MMQIFLDNIVFSIQKAGGVSVYWYELLQGICNTGMPVSFLNTGLNPANIFERRINYTNYNCIRESWIPHQYLRYLPVRYKLPEQSLFHGGYLRVAPQKNVLNILTVHDFAHERKLATGFPRGLANIQQKAYGIKRADGIICISDSTRQELLHFYPRTDPNRIRVIHHGITNDFYVLPKNDTREPYVLYVGARANYKNFNIALATMKLLPAAYQLVVAGGGPWSKQEMQEIETAIPGRYKILQTVDTQQLNRLYNDAFCLLYPTSYEGFGFPPGEAMKAGCPVVSTTATSIPEVTGRAGLLTKEINAAAFAEKIQTLENELFRKHIIQDGLHQASLFTWDKSVNETIQFYKDCWNNKF
jgi:glycosyltransferase involved in cell wall biosynthesis